MVGYIDMKGSPHDINDKICQFLSEPANCTLSAFYIKGDGVFLLNEQHATDRAQDRVNDFVEKIALLKGLLNHEQQNQAYQHIYNNARQILHRLYTCCSDPEKAIQLTHDLINLIKKINRQDHPDTIKKTLDEFHARHRLKPTTAEKQLACGLMILCGISFIVLGLINPFAALLLSCFSLGGIFVWACGDYCSSKKSPHLDELVHNLNKETGPHAHPPLPNQLHADLKQFHETLLAIKYFLALTTNDKALDSITNHVEKFIALYDRLNADLSSIDVLRATTVLNLIRGAYFLHSGQLTQPQLHDFINLAHDTYQDTRERRPMLEQVCAGLSVILLLGSLVFLTLISGGSVPVVLAGLSLSLAILSLVIMPPIFMYELIKQYHQKPLIKKYHDFKNTHLRMKEGTLHSLSNSFANFFNKNHAKTISPSPATQCA